MGGTIYYSATAFSSATTKQGPLIPAGVAVYRSTNDGASFTAWANAFPTIGMDKPWMAVDDFGSGGDRVYVAGWDGTNILVAQWNANTSAFEQITQIAPSQQVTDASVRGVNLVVSPDRALHVFYTEYTPANGGNPATRTILTKRGTMDGSGVWTFGSSATVANCNSTTRGSGDLGMGFKTNAFPQAAASRVDANKLYVVYGDKPAGTTTDRGDIFMSVSNDGGATWSSPIRVNDDRTTNDQWQATIAIKPDGSQVFVGWYDRRDDAANNLINTYGAIANAKGLSTPSFQRNFRISGQSFASYYGQQVGADAAYMGDYDQASALDDGFYYSWGDNRDATPLRPDLNQGANVYFQRIISITPTSVATDANNETLTVTTSGSNLRIIKGTSTVLYEEPLSAANGTTLIIDGLGGNDTITDSLSGSNQVDLIVYGGDGADAINGGAGNDTIYGNDGVDTLLAGSGNDSVDGGASADSLNGGNGTDTISYAMRTDGFDINLSANSSEEDGTIAGFENVTGSLGSEALTGSGSANVIDGGGDGRDTIFAGDGNDLIHYYGRVGVTATTIDGEFGTDTLTYHDNVKPTAGTYVHETVSSTEARVTLGGSTTLVRYAGVESFIIGTYTGADTITVNSLLSSAPLQINGGAGADTINVVQDGGEGVPVTVDGGDGLDTVNVNSDGIGTATVVFANNQDLELLHVFAGGIAQMKDTTDRHVLYLKNASGTGLTLATGRSLDVFDNDLVVDGDNFAAIRALLIAARNGGAWDGVGITSTNARTIDHHTTTLAAFTPLQVPVFDGFRINPGAALVKYTYYGDADLNGTVNFDDYSKIDYGFAHQHDFGFLVSWLNGDFDYNDVIDFDDYALIDRAFNNQGGTLFSGPGGGDPELIAIGQMPHFTQAYMNYFIAWNAQQGVYYTEFDFFPDGAPW